MLSALSSDELLELHKANWLCVEPGFIIDINNLGSVEERFVLVKEKNEQDETLTVVSLSQANVLSLLNGIVPMTRVIVKGSFLNVYATAITNAMCREREGLNAYCVACKGVVYRWPEVGTRNYRIGADGLCRHIDCANQSQSEALR